MGQGLPRPPPRGTDEELKKLGDESTNTWVSEATKGVESVVAVTFEPRGDQTEVTLCHSRVPDDEMGRQHAEGWSWVLSMLGERFSSHPFVPASA